ncbi:trichoplein keratin filament-binding protein-like isoform X2 [Mesocricetus auratus]|uniref:Trichoplein keratin filament-binding protein-like isoform X2 n=1 Tax=Mesocricetus auratus TaxID=10036 RepID=A0ABM2XWG0_MESAU|nr:trichoplein keratin filament-binding protein-like isoform X2 [Mesocricetus auratus]
MSVEKEVSFRFSYPGSKVRSKQFRGPRGRSKARARGSRCKAQVQRRSQPEPYCKKAQVPEKEKVWTPWNGLIVIGKRVELLDRNLQKSKLWDPKLESENWKLEVVGKKISQERSGLIQERVNTKLLNSVGKTSQDPASLKDDNPEETRRQQEDRLKARSVSNSAAMIAEPEERLTSKDKLRTTGGDLKSRGDQLRRNEELESSGENLMYKTEKRVSMGEKVVGRREKRGSVVEKMVSREKRGSIREKVSDSGEKRGSIREKVSDSGEKRGSIREKVSDSGEKQGSIREKVSDRRGSIREKVSDRRGSIREKVSDSGEKRGSIREKVSDSGEKRGSIREKVSDRRGSIREKVSDRRGSIREKVSGRRGSIREKVSGRRGSIREKASDSGERLGSISEKASDSGERLGSIREKARSSDEKLSREKLQSTEEQPRTGDRNLRPTGDKPESDTEEVQSDGMKLGEHSQTGSTTEENIERVTNVTGDESVTETMSREQIPSEKVEGKDEQEGAEGAGETDSFVLAEMKGTADESVPMGEKDTIGEGSGQSGG